MPRHRKPDGIGEPVPIVTNYRFRADLNAEVIELSGEIERVGVDALRRQHLGADCDDFSVHQTSGRPLMPTSTRYSALVVAITSARDGVKASPTIPGPERN